MDCLDEPESDNEYTDDSDTGAEADYRDLEDDDVYDFIDVPSVESQDSSQDDDMSADVLDAFLDLSEDATPQAIEVDTSSSSSMDVSGSIGEFDDIDDDEDNYSIDHEQDEEPEVDDDEDGEDYFDEAVDQRHNLSEDSDSDFVEYTPRTISPSGSSSRSRSPISPRPEVNQSENLPSNPILPAPSTIVDPPVKDKPTVKPSASNTENIEGDDSDGLCCICLDSESNHVVVPCGHICLCEACKDMLSRDENHRKKKRCPLCKTPYSVIIKTYK